MNAERLSHVLERLAVHAERPSISVGDALCATTVEVLAVDGAGLSLQSPDGPPYSVGVAGEDMAAIHEMERTLGEGPCIEAFRTGEPASIPDLEAATASPAFRAEAFATRGRAFFGYPLRLADECVGALNLYTHRTGPLGREQHQDALLLADLSTHAVVASFAAEPMGAGTSEIEDVIRNQFHVHQATGMISVQLRVSIVHAMARLRARAYAEERSVSDVARDVVERRLRFEE